MRNMEIGAWTPETLELSRVVKQYSASASTELREFIRTHPDPKRVEDVPVGRSSLPRCADEVDAFREEIDAGHRFVLVQPVDGLAPREIQLHHWALSNLLGETLVQNSEGDRLIHMWDRDPTARRSEGARYHQTREGGDVHTDNVNTPDPWDYLVVGCVEPAYVGGANVVLSGIAVHDYIAANHPDALEILKSEYLWEYRGIKDDTYEAPVLTYDESAEPHFRYLRTYMESAHRSKGTPMSDSQLWALNVLDAVLEKEELRILYKLAAGEILVTQDSQIFHARTCFADPFDAVSIDEKIDGWKGPLRRSLERTWVRKG